MIDKKPFISLLRGPFLLQKEPNLITTIWCEFFFHPIHQRAIVIHRTVFQAYGTLSLGDVTSDLERYWGPMFHHKIIPKLNGITLPLDPGILLLFRKWGRGYAFLLLEVALPLLCSECVSGDTDWWKWGVMLQGEIWTISGLLTKIGFWILGLSC